MSKLYQELATIYQAMYASFIDYEEEFTFYSQKLAPYQIQEILELGCGTGMLAQQFVANNFNYSGLDMSPDMLDLAAINTPNTIFHQGDMRHFRTPKAVESILIAGRTTSYLLTNQDLMDAFSSMRQNLVKEGVLCFDFIDANRFLPTIAQPKSIVHEAHYQGIDYKRESDWLLDLSSGMSLRWNARFYKKTTQDYTKIDQDTSVVRTFMLDEIKLFLHLNGFEIIEIIDRDTYAFPTYVVVAKAN